jgi:hypothetical protein
MWSHGLPYLEDALHGHGKESLKHFKWMCKEGVQPDDITFISRLSARSHAGLVDEGMRCYASMVTDYTISTILEHNTCMVDVLGRAGHLQEAENKVTVMHYILDVATWMALLGVCRIHGKWKWQNVLPNEFLKCSLTMLLVMCCCQTCMLLLAKASL